MTAFYTGGRMKIAAALLAILFSTAACSGIDAPPPAVADLMAQVTKACQAGNQAALKACVAREGVTSNQIEQHVGSWDVYFTKNSDPQYNWTFSGIRYVSLADAAHDKDILPDTLAMASGPQATSGITFAPNLKAVGFILITFKEGNGLVGGITEPVGMASDGTAKIALIEPKS
jgi:hypothetical protein